MIVHIVGDLHQPLHTTGAFDQCMTFSRLLRRRRIPNVASLLKPYGNAPLLHRPRRGSHSQPGRPAPRLSFLLPPPKSPRDVSYLLSQSANVARLCSVSTSVDFLQWAEESFRVGEDIYRIVGNGTEVQLTEEQVRQLQSVLLKQVGLIAPLHIDLPRRKASRTRTSISRAKPFSTPSSLPAPSGRDSIRVLDAFALSKAALSFSCL